MQQPVRIYLVEDNPVLSELLQEMITELGFGICGSAVNAREAVHGIRLLKPDLVLVDLMLGEKSDGIVVGEYLTGQTDIPFFYLTGCDDQDTLRQARQTRPVGFLYKPFDTARLKDALETGLQHD